MQPILTAKSIAETTVRLPPPRLDAGLPLMQALKRRHTSREFGARALDGPTLADLLWAAWGINRPASGLRTAPSARDWQEIDLYVALPAGAYRYDAAHHELHLVTPGDHRAATGVQEFVATAALNLVYVADYASMTDAPEKDRAFYSALDAGFIAQNVYLFCASAGLACAVRGLVDRPALARVLSLGSEQRIIVGQSVGYPA